MEEPLVSYVINTFNSEEVIEENLESIADQTHENREIIVVDNCSSDATRDIAESFEEVKFIAMPNSSYGACETFNIGFATARGEYIFILDDDVELDPDTTSSLLEEIKSDKDIVAAIPLIIDVGGDEDEPFIQEEKDIATLAGNCTLIEKSVLKQFGYYNEEFFIDNNDLELGERIYGSGYRIRCKPDTKCLHKRDPEAEMSEFRFFYNVRNRYWRYWQNYPMRDAILFSLHNGYKSLIFAVRKGYLLSYLKANFEALLKFWKYGLKKREPIRGLDYRPWTLENIVDSLKRELKEMRS